MKKNFSIELVADDKIGRYSQRLIEKLFRVGDAAMRIFLAERVEKELRAKRASK